MQISNNISPTFGSIQVGVSTMGRAQRQVSDVLFKTLKYDQKYSKLADLVAERRNDLDIYIMPSGKNGIEVRFMDPFSGFFVRDNNNRIIKEKLGNTVLYKKIGDTVDKVVATYEKIVNGVISRPKEDIDKVILNKTEMVKLNPDKEVCLDEGIELYKGIGYSQKEAEEQAFDEYKRLYHADNPDADF